MLALGVEGTAHTLGVGIVRRDADGRVTILSSENDMLRPEKGGIHPREAANHHAAVGPDVLARAIEKAGVRPRDLGLVSFSQGPGLGPCLRTAATMARAFALAAGKPIVGVNHCVAHLEVGRALGVRGPLGAPGGEGASSSVRDPVLLYASGGNTQVIAYKGGKYRVFGETLDVGVGNMLDKFAREEGFPFPGGPEIEKLARGGTTLLDMPYSVKGMDVAFSGILTAARSHRAKGASMEDVCLSLQETAFAMLVEVTERALAHTEKDEVVMGGGVACNERLWAMTQEMCAARGAVAYRPEKRLLVDNGAMIALQGIIQYEAGFRQTLDETAVDQRQRTDDIDVTWRPGDKHAAYLGAVDARYRGAEAETSATELLGRRAVRKSRVVKGYRLAALDNQLRSSRTRAEARLLSQARAAGVRTPIVLAVEGADLVLERIDGEQLKERLERAPPEEAHALLRAVGAAAARLHARGLVHGDLTTSNVLVVRGGEEGPAPGPAVVLIDFGLASLNAEDEDKGSDLHVLMEALEATHSDLHGAFEHVLAGYAQEGGTQGVQRKVDEIVQRGRYRGT